MGGKCCNINVGHSECMMGRKCSNSVDIMAIGRDTVIMVYRLEVLWIGVAMDVVYG